MDTEINVRIKSTIPIFSDSVLLNLDNPPSSVSAGVCNSIIKNGHWENHEDFTKSTDTTNVLPLFATEDDFQKADTYTTQLEFEEIGCTLDKVHKLPGDVNARYPIFAGYQLPPIEVG